MIGWSSKTHTFEKLGDCIEDMGRTTNSIFFLGQEEA